MSNIYLTYQSLPRQHDEPTAPAEGWAYFSTALGYARIFQGGSFVRLINYSNYSTIAQTPAATTRTYITGSVVPLGAVGAMRIGTMFRWRFNMTKTAAGTASSTIDIAFGTAGTTADTARVSFTKPGGVANADECCVQIDAICRGPLTSSGIVTGQIVLLDNQTGAGGHLASGKYVFTASVQSSGFDVTAVSMIGVCITTGASDAITIQQVQTQAWYV
jgi:hypothetical protein